MLVYIYSWLNIFMNEIEVVMWPRYKLPMKFQGQQMLGVSDTMFIELWVSTYYGDSLNTTVKQAINNAEVV